MKLSLIYLKIMIVKNVLSTAEQQLNKRLRKQAFKRMKNKTKDLSKKRFFLSSLLILSPSF